MGESSNLHNKAMWKNVFIEAALLSVIIFGGFYINANLMIREIHLNQKNILVESLDPFSRHHVSGSLFSPNLPKTWGKISGHSTTTENRSSISGLPQGPNRLSISGNKA